MYSVKDLRFFTVGVKATTAGSRQAQCAVSADNGQDIFQGTRQISDYRRRRLPGRGIDKGPRKEMVRVHAYGKHGRGGHAGESGIIALRDIEHIILFASRTVLQKQAPFSVSMLQNRVSRNKTAIVTEKSGNSSVTLNRIATTSGI